MQLMVVGATGPLGRAVVDSALGRGHNVKALVRNPQSATLPDTVQTVQGDVLDPASLEPAARGCEAVVCVLGTPSPRTATTLLETGTANLVTVMKQVPVPRLVCVTLLGIGDSRSNTALLYRHIILRVLAPMVPDKEKQERVVRESGLDWVLVRPPPSSAWARGEPRVDPRGRTRPGRTRQPQRTGRSTGPVGGIRHLSTASDRRRPIRRGTR